MPYPVTNNASVQPAGTLQLSFRPTTAGLVNVTLVGFGVPPQAAPTVPVTTYTIKLHFELFKPGASTPVAVTDVVQRVVPPLSNRVVAFLNAPASAGDL